MLIDIPTKKPTLIVEPRHAEVVISEDEGTGLSLILPPLEDIAEMKALAPIAYSHRESSAHAYEAVRKQFISELERMKAKQDLYKESPTFANHLANLASVAGLYRDEEVFLRAAQLKMGIGTFFELRLGENLLSQDKSLEAERIFSSETLAMDIHAILRLAYFSIQRHEIDRALELVSRAVGIDPLDFGARLFEGGIKLVMGRPREALVSLKIAIEERPTSSSAHVNVGLCYWRLGMSERALSSLRTAVAIDPLNVNAVILLSDVAFALNQNESAIPSLRLLVEYEQKTPEIWARLARALYSLGQFDETISALKKQGARASDGEVWNNLGAAYIGRGDRRRALESFHYALEVYGEQRDRGYFVAARNLALLLSARPRAIPLIAKLTHKLLREDQHNLILRDRVLSDILALHINAIAASGRDEEAAEIGKRVLASPDSNIALRSWVAASLLSYFAITGSSNRELEDLIRKASSYVIENDKTMFDLNTRLLNNIAFAQALDGRLDEADRTISRRSNLVHVDSYITATRGLIELKKGHLEKAELLYDRAVGLAKTDVEKRRIRQRCLLELGKYWLPLDVSKSTRYFQRAHDFAKNDTDLILALQARRADALSRPLLR